MYNTYINIYTYRHTHAHTNTHTHTYTHVHIYTRSRPFRIQRSRALFGSLVLFGVDSCDIYRHQGTQRSHTPAEIRRLVIHVCIYIVCMYIHTRTRTYFSLSLSLAITGGNKGLRGTINPKKSGGLSFCYVFTLYIYIFTHAHIHISLSLYLSL